MRARSIDARTHKHDYNNCIIIARSNTSSLLSTELHVTKRSIWLVRCSKRIQDKSEFSWRRFSTHARIPGHLNTDRGRAAAESPPPYSTLHSLSIVVLFSASSGWRKFSAGPRGIHARFLPSLPPLHHDSRTIISRATSRCCRSRDLWSVSASESRWISECRNEHAIRSHVLARLPIRREDRLSRRWQAFPLPPPWYPWSRGEAPRRLRQQVRTTINKVVMRYACRRCRRRCRRNRFPTASTVYIRYINERSAMWYIILMCTASFKRRRIIIVIHPTDARQPVSEHSHRGSSDRGKTDINLI